MADQAPKPPAANLKKLHERAVCESLLKTLGIEAHFERDGYDQNEPDVLYRIGEKRIGIEVATAYYDESDAKQDWTLARGERQLPAEGYELREAGVIGNPDERICDKIQEELADKAAKKYQGADEFWLCISQEAPLSDAESVAECLERLDLPAGHGFAAIYLLYVAPEHEGGQYHAEKMR